MAGGTPANPATLVPTWQGATLLGLSRRSDRRQAAPALPEATASTTSGGSRHAPSRGRRNRRSDRKVRPRRGSCRTGAAAVRNGRSARRLPGPSPWPADRTAGRGWAQRAPEVAASSDFCDYRYHHRAPSRLLVDGLRDRVVDRLLENVHVRMSVRETLEACHGGGARIGHQPG